jgi:hypothetical protein
MVLSAGCVSKTVKLPQLVYPEDVPQVQFPDMPPVTGNIKDLEIYSGLCTIELERLNEQLDIFERIISNQGVF